MTEERQKRFEEALYGAIRSAAQAKQAPKSLVRALETRLSQARDETSTPPLSLAELESFEDSFRQAVRKTAAPPLPEALHQRLKANLISKLAEVPPTEREVREQGADLHPAPIRGVSVLQDQLRWIKSFDRNVSQAVRARSAPAGLRAAVVASLSEQAGTARRAFSPKVVPLPSRSLWKQALTAAASVAAVVGLLVGTFLTSAESALANSVRRDHQRCGQRMAVAEAPPNLNMASASFSGLVSRFGAPPELKLDDCWTLRGVKVCRGSDGRPMLHQVYVSCDENGNNRVLSCHLIPPPESESVLVKAVLDRDAEQPALRTLADGELPVLVGEISGWTYTACTSDLDSAALAQQFAGL